MRQPYLDPLTRHKHRRHPVRLSTLRTRKLRRPFVLTLSAEGRVDPRAQLRFRRIPQAARFG
jgi:hypothetical protein